MNAAFNDSRHSEETSRPSGMALLGRTSTGWLALAALLLSACGGSTGGTAQPDGASTVDSRPTESGSTTGGSTATVCSLLSDSDLSSLGFSGAGSAELDSAIQFGGAPLAGGGNSDALTLSGDSCGWGEEGSTRRGLRLFVARGVSAEEIAQLSSIFQQEQLATVPNLGDIAFSSEYGVTVVMGSTVVLVKTRAADESRLVTVAAEVVGRV